MKQCRIMKESQNNIPMRWSGEGINAASLANTAHQTTVAVEAGGAVLRRTICRDCCRPALRAATPAQSRGSAAAPRPDKAEHWAPPTASDSRCYIHTHTRPAAAAAKVAYLQLCDGVLQGVGAMTPPRLLGLGALPARRRRRCSRGSACDCLQQRIALPRLCHTPALSTTLPASISAGTITMRNDEMMTPPRAGVGWCHSALSSSEAANGSEEVVVMARPYWCRSYSFPWAVWT